MKIRELMDIEDFAGLMIKIGLLGGLEAEEILALYRMPVCINNSMSCQCPKLHLVVSSKIVFVDISGNYPRDKYTVILPFALWKKFRELTFLSEDDLALANAACQLTGVNFCELAMIHEHIHSEKSDLSSADCSCRNGNSSELMNEIRAQLAAYCSEWENYDVDLFFL